MILLYFRVRLVVRWRKKAEDIRWSKSWCRHGTILRLFAEQCTVSTRETNLCLLRMRHY